MPKALNHAADTRKKKKEDNQHYKREYGGNSNCLKGVRYDVSKTILELSS